MPNSIKPSVDRAIILTGPVMFLTCDPEIRALQLTQSVPYDELIDLPLLDNVSTDEIIPGWCCYWFDEKLGDYAYLGLRDSVVFEGAIRALNPQVIVSGSAKGCGSSREHAVYAEKYAGIRLIFARSFEKIYEQNCRNTGILTCDDFDVLHALLAGEEVARAQFTRKSSTIERTIIDVGGLFEYNRVRRQKNASVHRIPLSSPRPLNSIEKIIQRHVTGGAEALANGSAAVSLGESYFVDVDIRFSHEYVTPMAAEMFDRNFGDHVRIADPNSCYYFQDHLTLAEAVLRDRPKSRILIDRVRELRRRQREFSLDKGGVFVGGLPGGGSDAICHNYVLEKLAVPGHIIVGTDSHTSTAGAVGALAFGVGATDIANAWFNRKTLIKVPEVVRIEITGNLPRYVSAKDAILQLLADSVVQNGHTRGRVLLFTGDGCGNLTVDERATLCNMAVEARGITGCVEPAEPDLRGDDGAYYPLTVQLALDAVQPMVSLPGDPTYAIPISSLPDVVPIDRAYGGSCTGGKAADMDMYAAVIRQARELGIATGVQAETYIQVGSAGVLQYATERGYIQLFEDFNISVLDPSCGACINAGPGVSKSASEVTVSAQSRNFPGRSGPGMVYLASPYVVAASAIAGRLCSPGELFEELGDNPCA